MLLNPDRMTMNYTMTDLVRACTTLACVACSHSDLLTIEPICMCRDALGPSWALMSALALRPTWPVHEWMCLCFTLPMACE